MEDGPGGTEIVIPPRPSTRALVTWTVLASVIAWLPLRMAWEWWSLAGLGILRWWSLAGLGFLLWWGLGAVGILLWSLSQLIGRQHWWVEAGCLERHTRILLFSWTESFPSLRYFELVHGRWKRHRGSTDRLQFWVDGREEPILLDSTEGWRITRFDAGLHWWQKNRARGQWTVRRPGLPPSPVPTPAPEHLPQDRFISFTDPNLLALGVLLANRTGRPLRCTREVVDEPGWLDPPPAP